MESKKINRQFNSLFWGIIYVMPLLILVITYFGYFNMYKENQDYNITSSDNFISELKGEHISSSGVALPVGEEFEYVYLNTSLSNDDILLLYNTLDTIHLPAGSFSDYTLDAYIFCATSQYLTDLIGIFYVNELDKYEITYNQQFTIWDSVNGWHLDCAALLYDESLKNYYLNPTGSNIVHLLYDQYGTYYQNDKFSALFSISPYQYNEYYVYEQSHIDTLLIPNKINKDGVESTEYLSLFDLSIKHTIDTFDGFVFEPLHNTFTSVLPKINFSNNTLIAQLVILIFTWFVQGMFIHIIVDTITLVPKMYHKMMERWLG